MVRGYLVLNWVRPEIVPELTQNAMLPNSTAGCICSLTSEQMLRTNKLMEAQHNRFRVTCLHLYVDSDKVQTNVVLEVQG